MNLMSRANRLTDGSIGHIGSMFHYAVNPVTLMSKGGTNSIVDMFFILLLAGALVPTGIGMFLDVNKTGWSATMIALWGLVPMLCIVGLAILIINKTRGSGAGRR